MVDLRQELLAVFDAEYRDHLRVIRDLLTAGCGTRQALAEIFRRMHSLKGAARAVEIPAVEEIAHDVENRLSTLMERGGTLDDADIATISRALDDIDAIMEPPPPPASVAPPDGAPDGRAAPPATGDGGGEAYVQVPVSRLDALSGAVHDLMGVAERHDRLWERLGDLMRDMRALSHAPQRIQADPVAIFSRMTRRLMAIGRDHELMTGQGDRALQRLGEEVHAISLVPAGTVFGSLAAMARRIAREHGGAQAQVEVRLRGMEVQAERRVMQALRDPVLHLLRNAIVHGHESRAQRLKAGKPEQQTITLTVTLTGVRLQVRVSDDGCGPDLKAIAARAVRQGMIHVDAPLDARQLLPRVFEPGFSTRAHVDHLAGRGVGLSIVAEAARALHGTVAMEQGQPCGTVVTLTVPVSQRQRTVLLVENGKRMIGLPGRVIRHLLRVMREDIRMVDGCPFAVLPHPEATGTQPQATDGQAEEELVPIVPLSAFVGEDDVPACLPERSGAVTVAVMEVDGVSCGFAVERMVEVRTLLISDASAVGLDSELVPGIAWPREDRPVFVISPDRLFERWRARKGRGMHFAPAPPPQATPEARRAPLVLVVDDSITTRTLQKTILQAHGFDVMLAVDGEEALMMLLQSSRRVDVVVTDVEMPRMDGFALLAAIHADPRLADIPVVLMTSRDNEEEIRRGLEGGARAYITKQKFDQGELLATIRGLL